MRSTFRDDSLLLLVLRTSIILILLPSLDRTRSQLRPWHKFASLQRDMGESGLDVVALESSTGQSVGLNRPLSSA